ncbi:MAG: hypothetical protein KBD01_06610 [Acidobacteria bacterium]|nr:hypothetical protein [Acidobacteriota bacterium]
MRPPFGLLILLGAAAAGCASAPPRADAGRGPVLVQVLHRDARDARGRLTGPAAAALVDRAVEELTGEALPLDGWAALLPRRGAVTVWAVPDAGPVAAAARARLELLRGAGAVSLAEGDAAPGAGSAVVLVVRPGVRDGAPTVDPRQLAARLARPPVAVLADLAEPSIEGSPWNADEALASRAAAPVAFGARYVLTARWRGEIPEADGLAALCGVDLARLDWRRVAVAGP